ncbi:hypothetical protein DFH06DRAFT_1289557 [Mycena polygramma]|nr:hypothetical protein DFH06DRAFT_1289557 [Mycena polygramma]
MFDSGQGCTWNSLTRRWRIQQGDRSPRAQVMLIVADVFFSFPLFQPSIIRQVHILRGEFSRDARKYLVSELCAQAFDAYKVPSDLCFQLGKARNRVFDILIILNGEQLQLTEGSSFDSSRGLEAETEITFLSTLLDPGWRQSFCLKFLVVLPMGRTRTLPDADVDLETRESAFKPGKARTRVGARSIRAWPDVPFSSLLYYVNRSWSLGGDEPLNFSQINQHMRRSNVNTDDEILVFPPAGLDETGVKKHIYELEVSTAKKMRQPHELTRGGRTRVV